MSGYYPDYEHIWKGIVQSIFMIIAILLCIFGSKAMIEAMIAGTVSLWLIPVLLLMFVAIGLQGFGLFNIWKLYFEWKKKKEHGEL